MRIGRFGQGSTLTLLCLSLLGRGSRSVCCMWTRRSLSDRRTFLDALAHVSCCGQGCGVSLAPIYSYTRVLVGWDWRASGVWMALYNRQHQPTQKHGEIALQPCKSALQLRRALGCCFTPSLVCGRIPNGRQTASTLCRHQPALGYRYQKVAT